MAVLSNAGRQTVITVAVVGLLIGGTLAPVATNGVLAQQTQPETDNTVTRIEMFENGSARWTIQIRTRLDTEQRVDEYTAFQDRFRDDAAQYFRPFRTRIEGVVADAENVTGRQMQATNFAASTRIQEVPRRWGVVTYEFTWTNFATQSNGRVVAGDVFEGGFFIAAEDTLQIVAPDGYAITRVDPAPDSRETGRVLWNGREDFADARPRVAFAPTTEQTGGGSSDTTVGDGGSSSDTTVGAPSTGGDALLENIGWPAVVGLLVVILLVLGGTVTYSRHNGDTGGSTGPAERRSGQTGTPPTGDHGTASSDHRTGSGDHGTQEAVLTDEERVLELLEANGGRMRQAAIAEEFDWSASKTSRVVGRMADSGSVQKLQLGRENLVALPDEQI